MVEAESDVLFSGSTDQSVPLYPLGRCLESNPNAAVFLDYFIYLSGHEGVEVISQSVARFYNCHTLAVGTEVFGHLDSDHTTSKNDDALTSWIYTT